MKPAERPEEFRALAAVIPRMARKLGFQQTGISNTDLSETESRLRRWLTDGYHGEMSFLARDGRKRSRPELLVPGTLSIISVRMDYHDPSDRPLALLADPPKSYISRYAPPFARSGSWWGKDRSYPVAPAASTPPW